MKTQNSTNPKNFRKALKAETAPFEKAYIQARKSYESSLKGFVIKNITGNKKDYKKLFQDFYDDVRHSYKLENGSWAVDNLMTLEVMVSEYGFWLDENRPNDEIFARHHTLK